MGNGVEPVARPRTASGFPAIRARIDRATSSPATDSFSTTTTSANRQLQPGGTNRRFGNSSGINAARCPGLSCDFGRGERATLPEDQHECRCGQAQPYDLSAEDAPQAKGDLIGDPCRHAKEHNGFDMQDVTKRQRDDDETRTKNRKPRSTPGRDSIEPQVGDPDSGNEHRSPPEAPRPRLIVRAGNNPASNSGDRGYRSGPGHAQEQVRGTQDYGSHRIPDDGGPALPRPVRPEDKGDANESHGLTHPPRPIHTCLRSCTVARNRIPGDDGLATESLPPSTSTIQSRIARRWTARARLAELSEEHPRELRHRGRTSARGLAARPGLP